MLSNHLLALGVTATGGAAGLLAAAAPADPSGIGPYVGGGAGVIAVAALGEVTRRLLNGTLVPRATREHEIEQSAAIRAAGEREAEVMRMAERTIRLAEDSSGMVLNTAKALKAHTEETADRLAETTARQAEAVSAQLVQVARAVDDLRDELREIRHRGGPA